MLFRASETGSAYAAALSLRRKASASFSTSVSHDLRSPLASMIGSADSLARYGKDMGPEDRGSLLETIRVEGERLDRYIQNLLDMTRLAQQGLTLARDWIGVDELVGSAARRLERYEPTAKVTSEIDPGVGLVHVHPALIEQAWFNVMENAAKSSPPGELIRAQARLAEGNKLQIDVSDRGPGIPEDERRRIFVRSGEDEKVALLDAGANDYVTKPFGIAELMARIRAFLRVSGVRAEGGPVFDDGTLHIDLAQREVRMGGNPVSLTRKEFALLAALVEQPGRLVTQSQLLREMWGPSHEDDAHYLRILVGKLRSKLGDDGFAPRYIITEPGVGLRFIGDQPQQRVP